MKNEKEMLTEIYLKTLKVYKILPNLSHDTIAFGKLGGKNDEYINFYFSGSNYLNVTLCYIENNKQRETQFCFTDNGKISFSYLIFENGKFKHKRLQTKKEIENAYRIFIENYSPKIKDIGKYKEAQKQKRIRELQNEINKLK